MKERFKNPSAVMLILSRIENGKEEWLFQKRKNTGYCDGFYDMCASGHVEANESMKHAMCREAKEEIGITINEDDLEFVCLVHLYSNGNIYYNGFFKAKKWIGEPRINEPDKIEELKWIDINNLPSNLIDNRDAVIDNYKKGIKYCEFGWDF